MKKRGYPSPIRGAFHLLWNLNIKAVPSALVWAISFWFVIETHSLVARSVAIALANLAAMVSSVLVINEWSTSARVAWKDSFSDRFSWKFLVLSGLFLDLSLENLSISDSRSYLVKIAFLSIFLSCLILWLYALLVFLPLRTQAQGKENPLDTFAKAFNLVHCRKPYIFLSFFVMLFTWPIFFIYIFLALTFAQCVIVSSSGDLVNASVNSPKMRVQVA